MSPSDTKQTDVLIHLGQRAELWHTPDGGAFATLHNGGARMNLDVESRAFREWLAHAFWKETEAAAGGIALKAALEYLRAEARFEGPERRTFIRVAPFEDRVYLDLGGADWRAVEIRTDGWEVTSEPPVWFRRADGMQALPEPVEGGRIEDLRPFVNVATDRDFILVVSWLLGALNPGGPYPIALIQGEQGSAKSTLARVLRSLVDPATLPLTTAPSSERDLAVAAHGSWVQAFDNLSGVPHWLSDAMCRLATGGGFKTRKLYSDTDQITLKLCRPQILNGIEDLATRDDLRDRGLLFELPVIPPSERQQERDLWQALEDTRPRILGAMLDAVSVGLRERKNVQIEELPRMADFATWVSAACTDLPWSGEKFLEVYENNRRDALAIVLDHDPLGEEIISFARLYAPWDGTATALRAVLRGVEGRGAVPPTPAAMSQALKRLAPALRQIGVDLTWYRDSDYKRTRKIAVRLVHPVQEDDEHPGPPGTTNAPADEGAVAVEG